MCSHGSYPLDNFGVRFCYCMWFSDQRAKWLCTRPTGLFNVPTYIRIAWNEEKWSEESWGWDHGLRTWCQDLEPDCRYWTLAQDQFWVIVQIDGR